MMLGKTLIACVDDNPVLAVENSLQTEQRWCTGFSRPMPKPSRCSAGIPASESVQLKEFRFSVLVRRRSLG